MYGSHPHGTMSKRDIPRRKSIAPMWRTRDGETHRVRVRKVGV